MAPPVVTPLMNENTSTQTLFLDLGATLEPSKEGIQDTARAKSQSSNSQGATGPSGSRPDSKGT